MEGYPRLLQRTRLDDAGTCIFAAHPDYALALTAPAPKASYALQMHVPATEYVASLGHPNAAAALGTPAHGSPKQPRPALPPRVALSGASLGWR
jgi:hypothetical protein